MLSENEFLEAISVNERIIHKVCSIYMHTATDREDLFQEILLNAWKGVKGFRGESRFSTWLYRVALNTAITFLKAHQKKPLPLAYPENIAEEKSSTEEQEKVAALHQAVDELNEIEKAIVMLYFDNYSHQEIGEIIGITANHVGVKMNRIRDRLKTKAKKFL